MGDGLSDGINQGGADPNEFRTAPLWGVGQRVFFLHDGRTTNLVDAIEDHRSRRSEAHQVIERFNRLKAAQQQDIINFLRFALAVAGDRRRHCSFRSERQCVVGSMRTGEIPGTGHTERIVFNNKMEEDPTRIDAVGNCGTYSRSAAEPGWSAVPAD